ncbi:MAG: hydroxymethylbilane synthase [Actinomycetota bacterium]
MPLDHLVIATRGSRLALRQAELVAAQLAEHHPGLDVELQVVTTSGDRDRRPFADIDGTGLFMAEVERAVLDGRADIAVHSAKDLTAELAEGAVIACVPRRGDPRDVIVGGRGSSGQERLGSLPSGARVGTSSMRRQALALEARPDLQVVELRGNVDTRLATVARGEIDAAVLAAAGLERLEAQTEAGPLDESWWVPAPGQGALAIESVAGRSELAALLAPLGDPRSQAELICERAFATRLEGGCSVPLGCLATARGSSLVVTGFLGAPDGSHGLRDRISGPASDASAMGIELAEAILASGGKDILDDVHAEAGPS